MTFLKITPFFVVYIAFSLLIFSLRDCQATEDSLTFAGGVSLKQGDASPHYQQLVHGALRNSGHSNPEAVRVRALSEYIVNGKEKGYLGCACSSMNTIWMHTARLDNVERYVGRRYASIASMHVALHEAQHIEKQHGKNIEDVSFLAVAGMMAIALSPVLRVGGGILLYVCAIDLTALAISVSRPFKSLQKHYEAAEEMEAELGTVDVLMNLEDRWYNDQEWQAENQKFFKGKTPQQVAIGLVTHYEESVRDGLGDFTDGKHPTTQEHAHYLGKFYDEKVQGRNPSVSAYKWRYFKERCIKGLSAWKKERADKIEQANKNNKQDDHIASKMAEAFTG